MQTTLLIMAAGIGAGLVLALSNWPRLMITIISLWITQSTMPLKPDLMKLFL